PYQRTTPSSIQSTVHPQPPQPPCSTPDLPHQLAPKLLKSIMKCSITAAAVCAIALSSSIAAMSVLTGGKECKPSIAEEGVIAVATGSESGSTYVNACGICQGIGACKICGRK
ncbi:hypothetical protein PSHT_07572, partial [Puccinia striiformis]